MSGPQQLFGGGGAATNGFFAGGNNLGTRFSVIQGLSIVAETMFIVAASLVSARDGVSGLSAATKGYFGGGFSPTTAEIDGIRFYDRTAINPAAALTQARDSAAPVYSGSAGFWGGGWTATGRSSEVDGLNFSSEATLNPAMTLSTQRGGVGGLSSAGTAKGYFAGGNGTGDTASVRVDGIRFQDQTAFTPAGNLTQGTESPGGLNSADVGYVAGGYAGFQLNRVVGIRFSDEAAIPVNVALNLGNPGTAPAPVSGQFRGYVAGGWTGGAGSTVGANTINRIDFVTVATTTIAAVLSQPRGYVGGVQG